DLFVIHYSPSTRLIEINFSESSSVQVQLIDLSGRIILTKRIINQRNINLDTDNVKNGLYLLVLNSNSIHSSKKILIQNL
ncbi:MAG TPA: hypothetical protein DCX03_04450, partial [Bacteroidales bacterium]|nr:hypothetical protein [Bacteroidales bacterium]